MRSLLLMKVLVLAAILTGGAACGAGAGGTARAVRPEAPTARAALDATACSDDLFVVDLPSDQRAALEAAMRERAVSSRTTARSSRC